MAHPKPAAPTVLKIIAGAQAGAEVLLEPGEYVVGTGPDDDLQIIDVSMKPGHAVVRLAPGKIEIKSAAGSFHSAAGVRARAEPGEWQELQPLDVVTTGATRFAFGPPGAQWSTIADHGQSAPLREGARSPAADSGLYARAQRLAIPLSLLILVLAFAGSFFIAVNRGVILARASPFKNDLGAVRTALDRYPFGRKIVARQDVDGSIYVSGFVETPAERRAIIDAIDAAGAQVRLRLGVLQVLRSEIEGLIRAERVNLRYDLTPDGDLTLRGVILSAAAADRFIAEARENVIGVNKIRSEISTARTLLDEIQALARLSQIDDAVVFRLDGTVVEANGIISVNKIDQWVGFLQAYSRRFGAEIGLRSYVQLQDETAAQGSAGDVALPILFGAGPTGKGLDLDPRRLRSGDFDFGEIFARPARASAATAAERRSVALQGSDGSPATATAGRGVFAPNAPLGGAPNLAKAPSATEGAHGARWLLADAEAPSPQPLHPTDPAFVDPAFATSVASGAAPLQDDAAPDIKAAALPAVFRHDVGDMSDRAGALVTRWLGGRLTGAGKAADLDVALDALANQSLGLAAPPQSLSEASKELFARKYLPLFALSRQSTLNAARRCRPGSRLSLDNLPAALFWLDLMSTTNAMTLQDFDLDAQGFILEAALNPKLVAQCLRRDPATARLPASSIYLTEARRNPAFVRFVTQSLQPFSLDVTGASLWGRRFVQLRDGSKLREGEAPDAASRIDTVGELGVAILLADGFAAVIYGSDIAWLAER